MNFAPRVYKLEPEGAYFMLSKAQALEAQGRSIIHLEIGQPDLPTFPNIVQAGILALEQGYTRYSPPAGIEELRRTIANEAAKRYGLPYELENVVVGPGAKPFLFFPTLALISPGDEVMVPDPGFPTYQAMIEIAGGVPVPVPLDEKNGFGFNIEAFDQLLSQRTKLIIINSPSNPTGGVIPRDNLKHIANATQKHQVWILSDEIYSRLVYETPYMSISTLPGMMERTIICDGFSKTYAMTGWRLGYGIMPKPLAERVSLLLTHSIGCTASFSQIAGIEAITGPQSMVDEVKKVYQARRDELVKGLNSIPGINCQLPQGAFYAFPNIKSLGHPSEWVANYLLDEVGVAVLPGTSFGKNGEGYLRLCFANSLENLLEAVERMRTALTRLRGT